jgi:acyl transferase domain-containing protein
LPTYPFQRERFWLDVQQAELARQPKRVSKIATVSTIGSTSSSGNQSLTLLSRDLRIICLLLPELRTAFFHCWAGRILAEE